LEYELAVEDIADGPVVRPILAVPLALAGGALPLAPGAADLPFDDIPRHSDTPRAVSRPGPADRPAENNLGDNRRRCCGPGSLLREMRRGYFLRLWPKRRRELRTAHDGFSAAIAYAEESACDGGASARGPQSPAPHLQIPNRVSRQLLDSFLYTTGLLTLVAHPWSLAP
jgi:hypothetical protein